MRENLISLGIRIFPVNRKKEPTVEGGFHAGSLSLDQNWSSDFTGIQLPPGVVVIDLDTYKGMSKVKVEQATGGEFDWVGAFIQKTVSGGKHFAFRTNEDIKQGSDLFLDQIGKGFDTRVAGKGYICTGKGYTGGIDLLKLATPESLPEWPMGVLKVVEQVTPTASLPDGDKRTDEVRKMLGFLGADCGRSDWIDVAMALKHHYHDNDAVGWQLFNDWSASAPDAYDPDEALKQWNHIKPIAPNGSASITLATVAYKAVQNGYNPSPLASEVFGQSGGGEITTLIDRIATDGGNPDQIEQLTQAISTAQCSDIQRAALTATLQRTLKEHGIKIPEGDIRKATQPPVTRHSINTVTVPAIVDFKALRLKSIYSLSGDHRANAEIMIAEVFKDRLARFDGHLYWWTGRNWQRPTQPDVLAAISAAFSQTGSGKTSNVNGTRDQLVNTVQRLPMINPSNQLVFFLNGVLDLERGLIPHDPNMYNTSCLACEYEPNAKHPEWDKFLESIFYDDPDQKILLQEVMGWCLISSNLNIQKAIALDGASRGGKGTILGVLANIMGDSAKFITYGALHQKQTMSKMRHGQVAIDMDAKRPDRRDTSAVHSTFNRIVADEPVDIKINYQQETWNGRLGCKLLISCNGIPVLSDDSGAAPRRWVIIKFIHDFTGREDVGLGMRLTSETAAIASWAVEGLRRLVKNRKFTMPKSTLEAIRELTNVSSPLKIFIEDRLEFGDADKKITTSAMWESFRQWCGDTNTRCTYTSYNFGRFIKQLLVEQGAIYAKVGNQRGYHGVTLARADNVIPMPTTGAVT